MKPASATLILILGSVLGQVSAGEAPIDASAGALIATLTQQQPEVLFDMHGNATPELQQLQILRFSATHAVTEHIDRSKHNTALREALYRVLGFVKDPASLPWLRANLKTDKATVYEEYVPSWSTRSDGYGGWEWLTGRDEWISFWKDTFNDESATDRRVTTLCILAQFDDISVQQFFAQRRRLASDPKEILIVESYLGAHDTAVDDQRIRSAISRLARSTRNREFLFEIAGQLKHEAFVPTLIDAVDVTVDNEFPARAPAQGVLKSITFETTIEGKDAWQAWFAMHSKQGRRDWRRQALDAFRELLRRDPDLAEKQFKKSVHYWNDIELYPFIEGELLPNPVFHSHIAGWINLTYTDFHRQRLGVLAQRISQHPEHLEDWARNLLQRRGYLPGYPKQTWAETVEADNRRL